MALPPIEIREARRDEWPAIERLVRDAWHDHYCTTGEVVLHIERLDDKVESLREMFNSFGSKFLVADDGGRVVGVAVAHVDDDGVLWIDDLFVEASSRRQGVARALVKTAIPKDAETIVEVNAENAAALALFRDLGFTKSVETVVLKRPPQG